MALVLSAKHPSRGHVNIRVIVVSLLTVMSHISLSGPDTASHPDHVIFVAPPSAAVSVTSEPLG